ncbi:oligopeptide ABC transporter permease [Bifidobacterium vespertilionis]|uniref:oligopeptide ABC transporter permease n=1 Tax=Bifidobacterium vespertilionis TaxID=2562524 RepID=UPI001BDD55E9|nr:oligopeptide ABC transporter permease [Bifidobacterium vespertilionis]MBT1180198.1 ABC transporter permease [Bifidobacterium vespertilionis]
MSIRLPFTTRKQSTERTESLVGAAEAARSRGGSLWRDAIHSFLRNRTAVIALIVLATIVFISYVGPFLSPWGINSYDVMNIKQGPSAEHWLGTDNYGRDVFTRVMYAGRISIAIGLISMIVSILFGAVLGVVSGYFGGWVDGVTMRIADIVLSIPSMPLMFIIAALLSAFKVPSELKVYFVIIMLSFVGWPSIARMIRGQVLSIRERMYVRAADVLGLGTGSKLFRHILPNTYPILIVEATLATANGIMNESALSFLGLGVSQPIPSWGNMISAANNLIDFQMHWWLWVTPGLAVFATVISINTIGDRLRDAFDPKQYA